MMRIVSLLLILCLLACGAQPAPGMLGAARHETRVGGHDYVLYRKQDRVEVIRLGSAFGEDHALIRANMIGVVTGLTGCDVVPRSIEGDSGDMRARITCRKGRR